MLGEHFFRSLREWSGAHRTRRELRLLSDAQLRDIGLSRYDIDAVASGRHPRATRHGF